MSTPVQPRCHLHLPIIDSAGRVFPYASITLLDADTGAPLSTNAYVQAEGGNPIVFPLFTDPAVIDIWTDDPVRAQVVAEVSDNVRIVLDAVDILPPAAHVVRAARGFEITGAEGIVDTAVLMSSGPGEATFRVADPVGTHEHEGDSRGSVVLTGEEPLDYHPYQTWVGHHAGRNRATSTTGSSAYGASAELGGASATIMGMGTSWDMATVLSSEDGDATVGSTVAGPGNLTAQGRDMTVLGGLTEPVSPSSVLNGSTIVGSGNAVGAAGVVKIGPSHPASDAGPSHVTIGPGNTAQSSNLPWSGPQAPFALGGSQITLGGDPDGQQSPDDWFGGVGPLAVGVNSPEFSPSIGLLQGNAVTQTALRVEGDVVVNGQRTHANTTTSLGFFGKTGTVRPQIPYSATSVPNALLDQVLRALARVGLIYTIDVPQVRESGDHPDGTSLEFAETGQALQWRLPPASPDYRDANPFTVASGMVVLNSARGPFPATGVPAIYSAGRSDVSVEAKFLYNPVDGGAYHPDDDVTGLMVRCLHEKGTIGGQTTAVTRGYLIGRRYVYAVDGATLSAPIATHATPVAQGQTLRVTCHGTSVRVFADQTEISSFTDSTRTTRVKMGYRLTPTTKVSDFLVSPFGF